MNEIQTENNQESPEHDLPLPERISIAWQKFSDWVWQTPKTAESYGFGLLRGILRVIFIVIRESQDDRITLRASALTFTVVLSLVPMLALGTAVLKGLGAGDQMRQAAYTFIEQFDSDDVDSAPVPDTPKTGAENKVTLPPPPPEAETASPTATVKQHPVELTSHLRRAVDQIFDYVDRTDFTTLGTFGIIGMVLAALGVLGSIEQSMNAIWQTTTGRALGRKIIDYMALMILLPISVNLALATAATLQSPALHSHIQNLLPVLWLERFFFRALPIGMLVITFSLLYQFLPNIRVQFIPALAGGLFGGLTWFWVQILYVKLQIGVSRYNAIYGSFATLPLFFLWIYIAWVVFLLGAEVAFAFQARRHYQWRTYTLTPAARLAMAFDIMEAALEDYKARKITDRKSLAQLLNQTEKTVVFIINDLVKGGLLRRVEGKLEGYVPSGPLTELKPSEIMDIILGKDLPDVKGCDLAGQALTAARIALDRYNLNCQEVTNNSLDNAEDSHCGTP
jgi:membrane protein